MTDESRLARAALLPDRRPAFIRTTCRRVDRATVQLSRQRFNRYAHTDDETVTPKEQGEGVEGHSYIMQASTNEWKTETVRGAIADTITCG